MTSSSESLPAASAPDMPDGGGGGAVDGPTPSSDRRGATALLQHTFATAALGVLEEGGEGAAFLLSIG
jgi:hypothetical protein